MNLTSARVQGGLTQVFEIKYRLFFSLIFILCSIFSVILIYPDTVCRFYLRHVRSEINSPRKEIAIYRLLKALFFYVKIRIRASAKHAWPLACKVSVFYFYIFIACLRFFQFQLLGISFNRNDLIYIFTIACDISLDLQVF